VLLHGRNGDVEPTEWPSRPAGLCAYPTGGTAYIAGGPRTCKQHDNTSSTCSGGAHTLP
jgi:hypothetical protein